MRPTPIHPTYRAWKLHGGVHYPLRIKASTLGNAVSEAQESCAHKDQFVVLESAGGKQTLRIYQIKQGKDMWVRKPGFAHAVKVHQLRADLIVELAVDNYEPVEAWQWTPGADVVGAPAREIVQ